MAHYLFQVICFEFRVVPVQYFLDDMQEWEVNDIVSCIKWLDRTERELSRYQLYVSVQSNSKKKLTPKDILSLPWDDEGVNKGTQISDEEAERIKARAKQLENAIEHMTFTQIDNTALLKNN